VENALDERLDRMKACENVKTNSPKGKNIPVLTAVNLAMISFIPATIRKRYPEKTSNAPSLFLMTAFVKE